MQCRRTTSCSRCMSVLLAPTRPPGWGSPGAWEPREARPKDLTWCGQGGPAWPDSGEPRCFVRRPGESGGPPPVSNGRDSDGDGPRRRAPYRTPTLPEGRPWLEQMQGAEDPAGRSGPGPQPRPVADFEVGGSRLPDRRRSRDVGNMLRGLSSRAGSNKLGVPHEFSSFVAGETAVRGIR